MGKETIYSIRGTEAGAYEVVGFVPEVFGSFSEHQNALLFLGALKKAEPSLLPIETAPAPAKPVATPKPEKPTTAKPANVQEPSPKPTAAPAPKTVASGMMPVDLVPDEDVWAGALDRLAAGEKINTVAEEIGETFGKLRSKWAIAIRAGTHQKPGADISVSGGVGAVLKRGGPPKRSPEAFDRDVAKLMGEPPLDDCQQSPAGRSSQDDNRT
jgi:hypothetical protein